MKLLVQLSDFNANYRTLSQSNYNTGNLEQHISDAQFVDVQKLMGIDFFNDLLRNDTQAIYQTLLNGGDYTYNNKTYTNVGLKSVIVFYAYSRYLMFGSNVQTPFGLVQKQGNNSQEISFAEKKTMSKMNEQTAYNYWENVRLFIERNKTDYPLWKENCIVQHQSFRISKIEKDDYTDKSVWRFPTNH